MSEEQASTGIQDEIQIRSTAEVQSVEPVEAVEDAMAIEPPSNLKSEEVTEDSRRSEAVHVRGVDDLSTEEVERWVGQFYPRVKFHVEWVDDTSVNLVFDNEEQARQCLDAITSEAVYYEGTDVKDTELRAAKTYTDKDGVALSVRIASQADKKERGARARSRYYLFHGEPTEDDSRSRRRDGRGYRHDDRRGDRRGDDRRGDDRRGGRRDRRDAGDDLFPDAEKRFAQRRDEVRDRSRSPGRRADDLFSRIDDRRQPDRSRDLADILDSNTGRDSSRWVKGDLLRDRSRSPDRRDRRRRHRAEDMF